MSKSEPVNESGIVPEPPPSKGRWRVHFTGEKSSSCDFAASLKLTTFYFRKIRDKRIKGTESSYRLVGHYREISESPRQRKTGCVVATGSFLSDSQHERRNASSRQARFES
jgi:hypothetical protein